MIDIDKYIKDLNLEIKNRNSKFINIKCPICGDSSNNYKARGYILLNEDGIGYNCFNCQNGMSFYKFLEQQNSQLARQYLNEVKMDSIKNYQNTKIDKSVFDKKSSEKQTYNPYDEISNFKRIEKFDICTYTHTEDGEYKDIKVAMISLPDEAILYLQGRGFKEEDYNDFMYCSLTKDIVIPFWINRDKNEIYGLQTRNIYEKRFHNQNFRINEKVYNLAYVLSLPKNSVIYCFESIFDMKASGIKNSIGIIGSKIPTTVETMLQDYKLIFCGDADLAGDEKAYQYAKRGFRVLIHEEAMYSFGDNAELLRLGQSKESIRDYILKNIKSSTRAITELKMRYGNKLEKDRYERK